MSQPPRPHASFHHLLVRFGFSQESDRCYVSAGPPQLCAYVGDQRPEIAITIVGKKVLYAHLNATGEQVEQVLWAYQQARAATGAANADPAPG